MWVIFRPFSLLKTLKSRKAVVEFYLSFKSFKSHKKVTKSFFSGHVSLSFHIMQKCPGTTFSLPVPTDFFNYNIILISMKKDVKHIFQ